MKMRIYIELDSIFDTRFPILKEYAEIDKEAYVNRVDDNFRFIGEGVFNILYRHRDRNTLYNSKVTLMVKEVNMMAEKLSLTNAGVDVVITVNTHPYKLLEQEIDKYHGFINALFPNNDVEIIHIKPTYELFSKYNVIVKYDGLPLLEDAFRKNIDVLSPDTSLVLPAIISKFGKGLNLEETFKGIMEQYKHIINVIFYDAMYWSYYE